MVLCWCHAIFVVSIDQIDMTAKYLEFSIMLLVQKLVKIHYYVLKISVSFCLCYFNRKLTNKHKDTEDGCLGGRSGPTHLTSFLFC